MREDGIELTTKGGTAVRSSLRWLFTADMRLGYLAPSELDAVEAAAGPRARAYLARAREASEALVRILDELEETEHYAWEGRAEYGCPKFTDPETWAQQHGPGAPRQCRCGRDALVAEIVRLLARQFGGQAQVGA